MAFDLFELYINEVVLGTAFGIAIGPHGADIFDPRSWDINTIFMTREITRIVLATGLFAIGVELPKSYMAKHGKSLLVMVVPTMTIVHILGVLFGLFPKLSFLSCLAIAACLTPTDPIVCAAIVGGKFAERHVPLNLRQILSAESATNDGLAFPFLTISLYLILDKTNEEALAHWVLVGYQVILGVVVGTILGLMFSHLIKFSHQRGFIDRASYVAQYLSLAVFITGIVNVIGSDDLLAAFAAGSAISWDGEFNDHTEGEVFSSIIDLVLNCACFMYIGTWLPFKSFDSPELGITPWRLVILFFVILLFRRIPATVILYRWIPEIRTWREALLSGHFGPVSSNFYSLLKLPAAHNPPKNEQELLAASLEPIVGFIVLCSIVIHIITPDWMLGIQHTLTKTHVGSSPVSEATCTPELHYRGLEGEQSHGFTSTEIEIAKTVHFLPIE
ncbi:hypothetical protein C0995_002127 [Termitomyces sp. Mi166|nr:hypothetical protein C0995_002127 [Termitomyces sp. Mi166\